MKLPRLLAVIALIVGTSLFFMPQSQAAGAYTSVICANAQGQTRTAGISWDNSQSFFQDKGYIPAFYCTGGYAGQYNVYVSDTLNGGALGYYAGVVPTVDPTPPPVVEPTPEPSATPTPEPSPTPTVEPSPSPEPTQAPEPSPSPSVEPTPQPSPSLEPEPSPTPQPSPEPAPEPTPTPTPSVPEPPIVVPLAPPVVEPQPPVVEPEPPVVEPEPPLPPEPKPEPVPEPEPPAVEPAPEPEEEHKESVTLDNGVVLTQEQAVAVALLQDPGQLLQAIFTDPGAALAAFGQVGADMSPEVREKSEKVVIAAVIAGQIAGQAAAQAAAGAAAYRRKL